LLVFVDRSSRPTAELAAVLEPVVDQEATGSSIDQRSARRIGPEDRAAIDERVRGIVRACTCGGKTAGAAIS
jgi:hypothetical protein